MLIVEYNWGIFGAAFATGLGYSVVTIIGVIFFFCNKRGLSFAPFSFDGQLLVKGMINGSSEMVGNLVVAITTFLFNLSMLELYGEDGIAAITIVLYFEFLFTSVFLGYATGIGPVISYKYGAKDRSQLKKVIKFTWYFVAIVSMLMFIISRATLDMTLGTFIANNYNVWQIAYDGFNIFSFSFLLCGFSIVISDIFTAFANGKISAIISFCRIFLFVTTCIVLLPLIFGKIGIWLAVPIAEAISILVSIFFICKYKNVYGY